jgi:hypothetical protein
MSGWKSGRSIRKLAIGWLHHEVALVNRAAPAMHGPMTPEGTFAAAQINAEVADCVRHASPHVGSLPMSQAGHAALQKVVQQNRG